MSSSGGVELAGGLFESQGYDEKRVVGSEGG
jgi:hypothetical protein